MNQKTVFAVQVDCVVIRIGRNEQRKTAAAVILVGSRGGLRQGVAELILPAQVEKQAEAVMGAGTLRETLTAFIGVVAGMIDEYGNGFIPGYSLRHRVPGCVE